jgi:uncharacterized protein
MNLVPPLRLADARAVTDFVDRLRDTLGERLVHVCVFGSRARGDAGPDSDLDVLVIVEPDSQRIELETTVSDIAFDVSLEHAIHVSPTVLTRSAFADPRWRAMPFLRAIEREGIPV